MERNELEKRLENESVYDTLMDIHSQLSLRVSPNIKLIKNDPSPINRKDIHEINQVRDIISMALGCFISIPESYSKKEFFASMKNKNLPYYELVLKSIEKSINHYSVKI